MALPAHGLALPRLAQVETARRVLVESKLYRVVDRWKRETGALRGELLMERMHTARMELWVYAMRRDVNNYTKEIWLR